MTFPELGYDKPLDRFATQDKGAWVKTFQDFCEVLESLVMYKFALYGNVTGGHIEQLLTLATGWKIQLPEMLKTGERIFNLKRMINARLGISRKDDTLHKRILTEPTKAGGRKGNLPDLEDDVN